MLTQQRTHSLNHLTFLQIFEQNPIFRLVLEPHKTSGFVLFNL